MAEAVTTAFKSLMGDIVSLLHEESSDPTLQLLVLDAWILNFQDRDNEFLHSVNIFQTLHKLAKYDPPFSGEYESKARTKVQFVSRNLFLLLGAICLHDHGKSQASRSDALQDSFFSFLAFQLENVLSNQPTKSVEISSKRNSESDGSHSSSTDSLKGNSSFDWFETLSFLFSLSASPIVQYSLSRSRYIRIFLSLLQSGDTRIQLLVLRLFKRILPRFDSSLHLTL